MPDTMRQYSTVPCYTQNKALSRKVTNVRQLRWKLERMEIPENGGDNRVSLARQNR